MRTLNRYSRYQINVFELTSTGLTVEVLLKCDSYESHLSSIFLETIRRTEVIDLLFERKLYGEWNRLC